jgi:integrase
VRPCTFHPAASTRQLDAGYDLRTLEELLGHADVETTMVSTHVLYKGGRGVTSPLEGLELAYLRKVPLPESCANVAHANTEGCQSW